MIDWPYDWPLAQPSGQDHDLNNCDLRAVLHHYCDVLVDDILCQLICSSTWYKCCSTPKSPMKNSSSNFLIGTWKTEKIKHRKLVQNSREISLRDLEAFSFHFSFSIVRHFHFTFHSQNEWTRFLFHFSLLKLPISTLAGHWYVTKTVLRLVFNSSINFNHILPVAWLNWNWVYCKSFFCSWLWRKFEQMQPV